MLLLCDNCNAVDLWDYLLLRMEGEVLGGMGGCRVGVGGLGAYVVWSLGMHDDMELQDDFTKVWW